MFTLFDAFSLSLLIACMGLFIVRITKRDTPVPPYLLIASTCLIANWLGDNGGGVFALMLLVSASFLWLNCLLHPHHRTLSV